MISKITIYPKSGVLQTNTMVFKDIIENPAQASKSVPWNAVLEKQMTYLSSQERSIFFAVFLIIYIVAFAANVYAIVVTSKRKHRYIQKACIISLSLSDLIMATAYTINYLESFSHPLINWTLGSFMCSFIPLVQIFGVIASCAVLVVIALDRYRNVIHALTKRWNPELWKCILGTTFLWAISCAVAYPMYIFFGQKQVMVLYLDENNLVTYKEEMYLCISDVKNQLMVYYICVASVIFLPLLVIFLWLYYNIAKLIWTHRKPLHVRWQKKNEVSSPETSSSQLKSSEEVGNLQTITTIAKTFPKVRSIQVERKIRTFKIIITLMLVFFICRLPYWIFNVMKLVEVYSERRYWIMTYIFNGLGLLNCALNPFLYTFLNPTLNVLIKIQKTINDFICRICCCCISNTEFEEFEKENPFFIDNFEKKLVQKVSPPPSFRERRPRVKFEDMQPIPKVSQDSYKEIHKY